MTIAQLHERFLACTGTCTDTRQITAGSLFFALKGPNFDANAFATQALEQGCRYAVVDDPAVAVDDRYLLVPDVLKALQDLATHHRRLFGIPVVAITGSNGKTTTKELVQAVLSADRPTLATSGNLNNHIGVPLTLLRLMEEHRIAIIEMGANKVGDIAELTAIAEPTHGLITNIGRAHLEGFGSFEGVIRAKTAMYSWVKDHDGTLFVNGDDPLLMRHSEGLRRVIYGNSEAFDSRGTLADAGPFLGVEFRGQDGATHVARTRLVGGYNLPNALAGIAIGQHFGVKDLLIKQALEAYSPGNNRSQFVDTGRNQLVLDAYNANPTSMKAALENFATMASDRPKLAILGGMKELGPDSPAEHQAVVDRVQALGLEAIYVGPEFLELGPAGALTYGTAEEALNALQERPVQGRLVLVKGSRGTKLETVVPGL